MTAKKNVANIYDDYYWKYHGQPIVGFFSFGSPSFLINDLDLAKLILIKDFEYFIDRRPISVSILVKSYTKHF